MAVAKLRELWKNEYFQTIVTIVLIVLIVFGFWFGSQWVLNTSYPALDVASTSMLPTLNVGDLIIVQGVPASQIHANYTTGDVIVFKSIGDPNRRIVHRAVEATVDPETGQYLITTRGDNNPSNDPYPVPQGNLIGRVVGKVPFLGNFALLTNALGTYYFIIIAAVIILIVVLALPSGRKEDKTATEQVKKRRTFGRIEARWIYLLIADVILILFIAFSIWGSFTFWQIGADPPQYVTIRGIYPDTAWYTTFTAHYNYVSAAFLSQGLLTYKVDASVGGLIRPGVPAFSWAQFFLVILAIVNVWMLIGWIREKRSRIPLTAPLTTDRA